VPALLTTGWVGAAESSARLTLGASHRAAPRGAILGPREEHSGVEEAEQTGREGAEGRQAGGQRGEGGAGRRHFRKEAGEETGKEAGQEHTERALGVPPGPQWYFDSAHVGCGDVLPSSCTHLYPSPAKAEEETEGGSTEAPPFTPDTQGTPQDSLWRMFYFGGAVSERPGPAPGTPPSVPGPSEGRKRRVVVLWVDQPQGKSQAVLQSQHQRAVPQRGAWECR